MLQIFNPPKEHHIESLSAIDLSGLARGKEFGIIGNSYVLEHATRPSTIGHVLASSPLVLLAWIGEKLRDWADTTPPIDRILEIVTFWWFTEKMPRSIYPYRQIFLEETCNMDGIALIGIPFSFTNFPKELFPVPESWAGSLGNMIVYERHDRGGHFAAMEVPELLAEGVKAYVNTLIGGNYSK